MPEPGRLHTVSVGTSRVAYQVQGSGRPLLMLHGAEGTRHMFGALVPYLQDNFTCISFDQRGSGDTRTEQTPYTADDIADDACAVLAHAGYPTAHVYGTSFGGIVAQSLAARHPACVGALVLGSTWASGEVLADVNPAAAHALAALRQDRVAQANAIAHFFYPAAFLRDHPDVIAPFQRAPAEGEAYRLRARCVATPIDPVAHHIQARTLVVAGAEDHLVAPDKTLELVRSIPCATGRILPGAGHLPCLQMPALLAAEIREFLDQVDPPH